VNCTFFHFFDENKIYHCTNDSSCPEDYPKLIKDELECVKSCRENDIYKYEFSSQCFEKCPRNTKISEESPYKCEIIIPEVTELITYGTKILDYLNITINENEPDESVNNFNLRNNSASPSMSQFNLRFLNSEKFGSSAILLKYKIKNNF
jgi:hypothetical protein